MESDETRTDLMLAARTAEQERQVKQRAERLREAARRYNEAMRLPRAA